MDLIAAFASLAALPVAWIVAERRRSPVLHMQRLCGERRESEERSGFLRSLRLD